MQKCTMNGTTFTLNNDGTIYINGNKVTKYKMRGTDLVSYMLLSFAGGMGFTLGIFLFTS